MTDVRDVSDRLSRFLPELEIRSAKPILNGWDSVVLDVNNELIARFPKREEIRAQMDKELVLLWELVRLLPGRVPAPRLVGGATDPDRFVTYEKLHGAPLTEAMAHGPEGPALAIQIGELLSVVHGIDHATVVGLGIPDDRPAHWRQHYVDMYDQVVARVLPTLEADAQTSVERSWRTFLDDAENFAFKTTLIHGDLACEHILCDSEQGRVVGVIDWGDARIGDPAFDFVGLYAECGWDFTRAAAAVYRGELGATWEQRVAFYTYVIPFIGLLHGAELGDSAILEEARQALAASLLAERP